MSKSFSHLNEENKPSMVNVGEKVSSRRLAKARALVYLPEHVMSQLQSAELNSAKGPVFQTAVIAGIMAAKRTGELIPLCHPLGIDHVEIHIEISGENLIQIIGTASLTGKTGVEMEALTGVSIAALTIYDMCKALSHDIIIKEICLLEKSGGKNDYRRQI